MRIEMAIGTRAELHVFETRRPSRRIRLVAVFAFYLRVHTRQRIARFGMVELLRSFPISHVVATFAILAQLPLVIVLMTRCALRRKPQIRFT